MTDASDLHQRSSQDAIPKDAVWLTEAYEYLAAFMSANPDLLPDFPGNRWFEALKKSGVDDFNSNGGSVTKEDLDDWRHRRRANLLMRAALKRSELVACVLHPRTGMVLQLHWIGWEPDTWTNDHIPAGIWSNFIFNDFESPGPTGTLLDGLLRPVFLLRNEFIEWISEKFGERAKPLDGSLYLAEASKGHRAVDEVNDAITALWGKFPPVDLPAKQRDYQINQWLKANGRDEVSASTIKRALALRRAERT